MLPDYLSGSVQDCIKAAEREIALRKERDDARMDFEGRKASEEASVAALNKLLAAVQEHRDQKADDRCWLDDLKLYAAAGLHVADNTISDPEAMLENCKRFIACRMAKGKWKTYQELERERDEALALAELKDASAKDLRTNNNNLHGENAALKKERDEAIAARDAANALLRKCDQTFKDLR